MSIQLTSGVWASWQTGLWARDRKLLAESCFNRGSFNFTLFR